MKTVFGLGLLLLGTLAVPHALAEDEDTSPTAPFERVPPECAIALSNAPRALTMREQLAQAYRALRDKALIERQKPEHLRGGTWASPRLHRDSGETSSTELMSRYPVGTYARFVSSYSGLVYKGVIVEYEPRGPLLLRDDDSYILLNEKFLDFKRSRPNRLEEAEARAARAAGVDGAVVDRIVEEEELTRKVRPTAHFRGYAGVFVSSFQDLNVRLGDPLTVTSLPAIEGQMTHTFSGSYQGFTRDGQIALSTGERYTRLIDAHALDPEAVYLVRSDWSAMQSDGLLDYVDANGRHTLGFLRGRARGGNLLLSAWNESATRRVRGGHLRTLTDQALSETLRRSDVAKSDDPAIAHAGLERGDAIIIQLPSRMIDAYYLGLKEYPVPPQPSVRGLDAPLDTVVPRREVWLFNRTTGQVEKLHIDKLRRATVLPFEEP